MLAAPVLSGGLRDASVLAAAAVAFVTFCLASSGIYFVNDARDVVLDREHPVKRLRPVAAGRVTVVQAYLVGAVLLVAALGLAAAWRPALFATVLAYVAFSLLYCFVLKAEPVIDIAIIASGFLLRAIAGGAAAGIELSQWFLLAASFGSLFVASGKRYAEITIAAHQPGRFRPALARYTPEYLRFVWTLSAGILIMTYGLWAFELESVYRSSWTVISMAPFVLAVLRYAVDIDAGVAGEPEEIALRDRGLQALALAWVVCIGLARYFG